MFAAVLLLGSWAPLWALDAAIVGTWEFADGSSRSWMLAVGDKGNVYVAGERTKVTTDGIWQ